MNVLELFSGTGSVGKVCHKLGWDTISVDLELPATHECDIMDFDYKQYPKDYFSIVWGSPPCTDYSTLQNCWLGRKKKDGIVYTREVMEDRMNQADKLVLKTFEIIEYFNPELWCVENPQTGKLKSRDIMKDIPFYDVSYCMYSDWGYEKKTRIWTNRDDWNNLVCDKSGSCGNMIEKHHKRVCDGGYDKRRKHKLRVSDVHSENTGKDKSTNYGSGTNRLDRYRIPPDLIYSLFLD